LSVNHISNQYNIWLGLIESSWIILLLVTVFVYELFLLFSFKLNAVRLFRRVTISVIPNYWWSTCCTFFLYSILFRFPHADRCVKIYILDFSVIHMCSRIFNTGRTLDWWDRDKWLIRGPVLYPDNFRRLTLSIQAGRRVWS